MRAWTVMVALVGVAIFAVAQQPDTQYLPGPKLDPAAVARGQKLFLSNCAFCHAADATGASGPDLLRSPIVLRDQHGESIGVVVHAGRPALGEGPAMPAFPALTDAEVADISAFLRFRIQAAADRMAYAITGLMTGNAQAGEAYFNGPGQCATCHSPTGDLAGIGRRYSDTQLLSRIVYPDPTRRGASASADPNAARARVTATVTLPSGQTVAGELVFQNEFEVVLRDAGGWDRGFALGEGGARLTLSDPLAFHQRQLGQYTDAEIHNLLAYLETLQ